MAQKWWFRRALTYVGVVQGDQGGQDVHGGQKRAPLAAN